MPKAVLLSAVPARQVPTHHPFARGEVISNPTVRRSALCSNFGVPSSTMSRMVNFRTLLNQLERERRTISAQLERLNAALRALGSTVISGRRGRISTVGRARIAAAQRARWAKARGAKVVAITAQRKRKISAAAIARIRAAQKTRWAKWKKQQKTA